MNNLKYFLRKNNQPAKLADLETFISQLKQLKGVGLTKNSETEFHLFYEDAEPKAFIREEAEETALEVDDQDSITVSVVKGIGQSQNLRLFSEDLGCYVPILKEVQVATHIIYKPILQTVFEERQLKPIFDLSKTDLGCLYVLNDKGEVHLLNPSMIMHCIDLNTTDVTEEFSYKVADTIQEFVSKIDVGLIPADFYKYYKRSLKIIDYSDFGIGNPGRKVFIKPYIFELGDYNTGFVKLSSEKGGLIFMDKIREGETLDIALRRILQDHLKIATDYIGAVVMKELEFDKDKNNLLTPRLVVKVFLQNENLTEKFKELKDRQWVSQSEVKY